LNQNWERIHQVIAASIVPRKFDLTILSEFDVILVAEPINLLSQKISVATEHLLSHKNSVGLVEILAIFQGLF
jgi:hypothetical protein